MIYLTGDCHGDYRRFQKEIFPEQREMTKEDYVIICGDFGFWDNSKEQKYWRKWLEEKPFTTLWIDGNHENFDELSKYPIEEWKGGKVQFITPSIIHLMRGQVFTIEQRQFFTFGGASSHDIRDGILDLNDPEFKEKKKRLDKKYGLYRINHISWWKEEMPSEEEYQEGRKNLEKYNWKVDYILSHCCPSSIQALLGAGFLPDSLTAYFEEINQKTNFKNWIFGHYHNNKVIQKKYILLYEQITRLL